MNSKILLALKILSAILILFFGYVLSAAIFNLLFGSLPESPLIPPYANTIIKVDAAICVVFMALSFGLSVFSLYKKKWLPLVVAVAVFILYLLLMPYIADMVARTFSP